MWGRARFGAPMGPATDAPAVLTEMVHEGLDVARLNASHGTRDDQTRRLKMLREIEQKVGQSIGTLLDLRGPKIRIESFQDGRVILEEGKNFVLDTTLD